MQEIQARREFFLSDLDYDNRNKSDALKEDLDCLQKQTASAKSTIGYAKEVLNETDPSSFLQLCADLISRQVTRAEQCLGEGQTYLHRFLNSWRAITKL